MAFTAQEKQALATWLQANIHKAVYTTTWREGVKQTIQVHDPIEDIMVDKEVPVLDGENNRTYIEQTEDRLDFDEVIIRTRAKARKHGYDPSLVAVEELLLEYIDTIKTWLAPGVTISHGNSPLRWQDVDAEDPDA